MIRTIKTLSELENAYWIEKGLLTSDELRKLSKDSLINICQELNIPYSGKNKAELIHIVKEEAERLVSMLNVIDDTLNIENTNHMAILEYIARAEIHVIIAKSIIKNLASPDMEKNSHNDCMLSCQKMFFDNWDKYKNPVIPEIYQDIFVTIMELVNSGYVTIENGFPVFADEIVSKRIRNEDNTFKRDKNGNFLTEEVSRSTYLRLYQTIRKSLSDARLTAGKMAISGNYGLLYDEDENGNVLERVISERSHEYRLALSEIASIEKIIERSDLTIFWIGVKERLPKKYHDLYAVFCGKADGLTMQEIADNMNISKRTCERLFSILKMEYELYGKMDYRNKNTEGETFTSTTCNGGFSASESYEFNYVTASITGNNIQNGDTIKVTRTRILTDKNGKKYQKTEVVNVVKHETLQPCADYIYNEGKVSNWIKSADRQLEDIALRKAQKA